MGSRWFARPRRAGSSAQCGDRPAVKAEGLVTKGTYAGVFLVSLATLMYEVLLTRIFSVTMWYHFAFMAVSIALFGMTVGALLVHLLPQHFTQERVPRHLAFYSLLFAVSTVLSFFTHLSMPFAVHRSLIGFYAIALNYTVLAVPFTFSGICICLALTKYSDRVGKVYAADIAGAALGAMGFLYLLNVTDGPTAVIVVAAMASIGAAFFAAGDLWSLRIAAVGLALVLTSGAAINTVMAANQKGLLRLMWVRGGLESRPLYEKWNSFSRVTVVGDPSVPTKPFGWGLSATYPPDRKVGQLMMGIDVAAGTPLTAFSGDLKQLEHLKYDVTNVVHYLRRNSRVLVVGAGGGRDVLSALVFGQASVVGVEINNAVIETLTGRFGDFTGHLESDPRVTLINDEARSFVAASSESFDSIHIPLTDTAAATAAGAFALTENSLYTIEAWQLFLEHLRPGGVLSVSRWYIRDRPAEAYRLAGLATAALGRLGVNPARDHIMMLRHTSRSEAGEAPEGIVTILVSKAPFSTNDIESFEQIAKQMKFDLLLTRNIAIDSMFADLVSGGDLHRITSSFPLDITPPTDDRPFFFHTLRIQDVLNPGLARYPDFNQEAVSVLGILLFVVLGLSSVVLLLPLFLTRRNQSLASAMPFLVFFACIGFGFMLVEVSQLQRLIIFLGHPSYSLSVTLFSLLLASALGSYSTNIWGRPGAATLRLGLLVAACAAFALLTPPVVDLFQASTTLVRVLVAIGMLAPLGFFMGMAFPVGMRLASLRSPGLTPWLWGVNGATSVCASVLAVVIALSAGIMAAFWTGFAFYVVGLAAFVWAAHSKAQAGTPNHIPLR